MSFIIVGYYTKDTIYEDFAQVFAKSMDRLGITYYLEAIKDLGGWYKNTGHKPTFLRKMIDKFDCDIVYVDCDAEFLQYPILFDALDCNVAAHYFDRRNHPNITKEAYEVLSGTIFLRNCNEVRVVLDKWKEECKKRPMVWDQKSLEKILVGEFYHLPGEYCKIFNLMKDVVDPVIIHYQASRKIRANNMKMIESTGSTSVPFPKKCCKSDVDP